MLGNEDGRRLDGGAVFLPGFDKGSILRVWDKLDARTDAVAVDARPAIRIQCQVRIPDGRVLCQEWEQPEQWQCRSPDWSPRNHPTLFFDGRQRLL